MDIRDEKLPGFVLRVRPSGTHSYFVNYERGAWEKIRTTAVPTAPEAREGSSRMYGARFVKFLDDIRDLGLEELQERQDAAGGGSPAFDAGGEIERAEPDPQQQD